MMGPSFGLPSFSRRRSAFRFISTIITANLILCLLIEALVIGVTTAASSASPSSKSLNIDSYEDNEFAEFEEFEEEEPDQPKIQRSSEPGIYIN